MNATIEGLTALVERKNWSITPAKLAKAIEEHPWPKTPKQQNDFREAAKVAWREHKENGGKAHDAKYPTLLWSFDAWKAPVSHGGGGSLVGGKRSGGSGSGKSATGNTRFTDAKQLKAMVLEVAKEVQEGDKVVLSRVVRTIRRERKMAITRSKTRAALNDLIASGKLKADPIPAPGTRTAKPKATKSAATKPAAKKATTTKKAAAKKAPAKSTSRTKAA